MALSIRLKRIGKAKQPCYRVVVADSRCARDGGFIDTIGTYDPKRNPAQVKIEEAKAIKWLRTGAVPTDTVRSILSKAGLMKKAAAPAGAEG